MRTVALFLIAACPPLAVADETPIPPFAHLGSPAFRHGQEAPVRLAGYSPDGKRLVTVTGRSVYHWDADTGELLQRSRPRPEVGSLFLQRFSPDLIVAAHSRPVWFWDTQTGERLLEIGTDFGGSSCPAISPDRRTAAYLWRDPAWTESRIRIVEFPGGREISNGPFPDDRGSFDSWLMTFSPDGAMLAVATALGSADKKLPLMDLREVLTGRTIARLPRRRENLNGLGTPRFTADGRVIAAQGRRSEVGQSLHLWEWRTDRLTVIPGVKAYALAPDSRTVAIDGGGGFIAIHDVATGKERSRRPVEPGGEVDGLAYRPDGKALARSSGRIVRVWDPATGEERLPFAGHCWHVNGLAFPKHNRLVTADRMSAIRWDVSEHRPVSDRQFVPVPREHDPVVLSPAGSHVARWDGETKRVLVSTLGGPEKALEWGHGMVNGLTWSPGGGSLVVWGNRRAVVFDRDGRPRHTRPFEWADEDEPEHGTVIALAPGGGRLAMSARQGVELWDLAGGRRLHRFSALEGPNGWITFSPDGNRLAFGGVRHAEVWSIGGAKPKQELAIDTRSPDGYFFNPAFSPDGKRLAIAEFDYSETTSEVRLWDMARGEWIGWFVPEPDVCVRALAFSPDGRTLAGGLEDGRVALWRLSEIRSD